MKEEKDHSFHIANQTKFIAMGDQGEDPNQKGKPESEGEQEKPEGQKNGAITFPKVTFTKRSQEGEQKGDDSYLKALEGAANGVIQKANEAVNNMQKTNDETLKRERMSLLKTVIPKDMFTGDNAEKEYQEELTKRANSSQPIEEVAEIWTTRKQQAEYLNMLQKPENKELALSLGSSVPDNIIRGHAESGKISDTEKNLRINALSTMFSLEVAS